MIYDGVLAKLLGIEMAEMEKALAQAVRQEGQGRRAELERRAGRATSTRKRTCRRPTGSAWSGWTRRAARSSSTGNAAAALGAMFAGVTVVTWYPITPSSTLCETLIDYMKRYRIDPETGKATFAIVQAEDELAAHRHGAGRGLGGRARHDRHLRPGHLADGGVHGPGLLRGSPGGHLRRPARGALHRACRRAPRRATSFRRPFLSHGDTKHPMLFPCSVEECYTMAMEAFDLAEGFQTPVFVMTDLDLGMNNWMADPFPYPDKPIERGKVLTRGRLERLGRFERYRDVDGDGIGYRTLPGTRIRRRLTSPAAAATTRRPATASGPTTTSTTWTGWRGSSRRRAQRVPGPVIQDDGAAESASSPTAPATGRSSRACDQLKQEHGLKADYCRLRAFPFTPQVADFIRRHQRVYVVEQNRDAQMCQLLRLELDAGRGEEAAQRPLLHRACRSTRARSPTRSLSAGGEEVTWPPPRLLRPRAQEDQPHRP